MAPRKQTVAHIQHHRRGSAIRQIGSGLALVVLVGLLAGCRLLLQRLQAHLEPVSLQRVEGWVPYWEDEQAIVEAAVAAAFSDVLLFHGTVQESGKVTLEDPAGLAQGRQAAMAGGLSTWFTITNHGRSLEGALGAGRLPAHVRQIIEAFAASGCDHLDLDYEYMTVAQANQLPRLARLLAQELPATARLSFTLQPVDARHRSRQKAMVAELLSMEQVDTVRFMMYDYAWSNSLPGALCPITAYKRILDTWSDHAAKLTMCLPLYGYDWPRPLDTSLPAAATIALRDVPSLDAQFVWMQAEGEMAARYTRDGIDHMVCLPSLRAIQERTALARAYGVPAIAFWHLGSARALEAVRAATEAEADVADAFAYEELPGWSTWLEPFKNDVCRRVTGTMGQLSQLAVQYGVEERLLHLFNQQMTNSGQPQTIFVPIPKGE